MTETLPTLADAIAAVDHALTSGNDLPKAAALVLRDHARDPRPAPSLDVTPRPGDGIEAWLAAEVGDAVSDSYRETVAHLLEHYRECAAEGIAFRGEAGPTVTR